MKLRTAVLLYGAACGSGDREKAGELFKIIEEMIEQMKLELEQAIGEITE